jgi:hypothetical protein
VLVLIGEEKHRVVTLWETPHDEASSRHARLAMHETVSAAVGMTLVGYEACDVAVFDVVGTEVHT